ncbi:MAG: nucleotidyltransferase family protein [Anaerolineales bacterium]|nr:nucleotidyltransferase family protein [Anaerolineales bacterium]
MKTLENVRVLIRKHQTILEERYGVKIVGLFGSNVRGEQKPDSDIDILADILRPISLLEFIGAELYLSELLDMKVDLVPRRALREELRESIFAEMIPT